MSRDWPSILATWSGPPSDTEDERCANAERMVKEAIRNDPVLAARTIRVYTHGSYRNNTNVKRESDVDVGVCLLDTFYDDYSFAAGLSRADTGVTPSTYTAAQFMNELGAALYAQFGGGGVTRGGKVWAVRENTYRVHADVAPTFELRRYQRLTTGGYSYESGTRLLTDDGRTIDNWPEQHAANGIAKNQITGMRFKKHVRILKRLRDEMASSGRLSAPIPSCLIESLLWNAADSTFAHVDLMGSTLALLNELAVTTAGDETSRQLGEINERKYLFGQHQTWTRAQTNASLWAAYAYLAA